MVTTTWNGLKQTSLVRRRPLRGNGGGLKRTPLKAKSQRQISIDAIWSGVRQQKILETGGTCEICGIYAGFKLIAHHKLRRSYNDHTIENCAVVCPGCHDRIDREPDWAVKLGFKIKGF